MGGGGGILLRAHTGSSGGRIPTRALAPRISSSLLVCEMGLEGRGTHPEGGPGLNAWGAWTAVTTMVTAVGQEGLGWFPRVLGSVLRMCALADGPQVTETQGTCQALADRMGKVGPGWEDLGSGRVLGGEPRGLASLEKALQKETRGPRDAWRVVGVPAAGGSRAS